MKLNSGALRCGIKKCGANIGALFLRIALCCALYCALCCALCLQAASCAAPRYYDADQNAFFTKIDNAAEHFAREIPAGSSIYIAEIEGGGDAPLETLRSRLKESIAALGNYSFISRLNAALITDEQDYFTSFVVDEARAERIAYKTGADFVIYGSIRPLKNNFAVSLFAAAAANSTFNSAKGVIEESFTSPPLIYDKTENIYSIYNGSDNKFGFSVSAINENGFYYEGDILRFSLSAERDCYVKIMRINVKGGLSVIFPLTEKDNNLLNGGAGADGRLFPEYSRIVLQKPYGDEYILAAAYESPFTGNPVAEKASRRSLIEALTGHDALLDKAIAPVSTCILKYKVVP